MVVTTMQNPLGQTLVTQGHVQLDLLVHSIHVPRGTIVKLAALVQLVVIVALEPTIKVKKWTYYTVVAEWYIQAALELIPPIGILLNMRLMEQI